MQKKKDTPAITVTPPYIYGGAIVVGVILHRFFSIELIPRRISIYGGIFFILFVVPIALFSIREFQRYRTTVDHKKPTTAIITTGPFRFTRNPLYLAGLLLLTGIGFLLNNIWIIGMLIPVIIIMTRSVIFHEEEYLTEQFGEKYLQYKSSVRRWL
jgi:protein-S-isoprenylcysteine O-methyltransferase Ste14